MTLDAAALGFRLLRTALLTSACFPEPPEDLGDRLLLLCELVLDPGSFHTSLGEPSSPAEAMARLGGRSQAAVRVQHLLESRTRPMARLPGAGSFEFLTVAAAAEAGLALFEDRDLHPEEICEFERLQAERGRGILHLLSMASRADGNVGADENRVIRVIQECLGILEDDGADYRPDPTAQELRDLFPTEEERVALVAALATVIAADGEIDPREETMCRVVAMALGVPRPRLEELLEGARVAAESGL